MIAPMALSQGNVDIDNESPSAFAFLVGIFLYGRCRVGGGAEDDGLLP